MGKSKGGKLNVKHNIFRVAGSKSLKAKNKPKILTEKLKQLNIKTKQKIENVDEQFNALNSEVRQSSEKMPQELDKQFSENVRSSKNQQKVERYNDSLKSNEETLNKLLSMEM